MGSGLACDLGEVIFCLEVLGGIKVVGFENRFGRFGHGSRKKPVSAQTLELSVNSHLEIKSVENQWDFG